MKFSKYLMHQINFSCCTRFVSWQKIHYNLIKCIKKLFINEHKNAALTSEFYFCVAN